MPYSSLSDLPAHVKKLPKKKQKQWMAIWNSVYAETGSEERAFAAANAIINEKCRKISVFSSFSEILGLLEQSKTDSTDKNIVKSLLDCTDFRFLLDLTPYVQATFDRDEQSWLQKSFNSPIFGEIGDVRRKILAKLPQEWDIFDTYAAIFLSSGLSTKIELGKRFFDSVLPIYEEIKPLFPVKWLAKAKEIDWLNKKRVVVGVVLVPDEKDLQNDVISAEEIEKAAHQFLMDHGIIGLMHEDFPSGVASVVESYVAPHDLTLNGESVSKGSWVIAVKIFDDDVLNKVYSGEYAGFSIGGVADRLPLF